VPLDVLTQMVAADVHRTGDAQRLEVVVRADRQASAGVLNALAAQLTRVGVKTWKLATEASN
jgi:biopolymer transport protein ExbD